MDDVIVYKGEEYSKEEIMNNIASAWERIKETVTEIVKYVLDKFRSYVEHLRDNTPVGFKRCMKAEQLKAYEKESIGKSNNWRKVHGLHLKRKLRDTDKPQ